MLSVTLTADDKGCMVQWSDPRPKNYYATLTSAEIQVKQQKLFDPWRTVSVVMVGSQPLKEAVVSKTVSYGENELTDVDSEDDLMERSEVERSCTLLRSQEEQLERRKEVSKAEKRLQNVFELTGLSPRTSYQVRVRCANKYGWGNYSKAFSFSLRDRSPSRAA